MLFCTTGETKLFGQIALVRRDGNNGLITQTSMILSYGPNLELNQSSLENNFQRALIQQL